MSGLNFIHLGFLTAGLAAAAPIVIHLLFRQRARRTYIGSVRFLQSVVREHHRRRRVRQWLLLALRMLVVLLLVLLFARPYLDRAAQHALDRIVVVLVDRSASMQTTDASGTSAYQKALVTTRRKLSEVPEGVVVHVGAFDSTGVTELPSDSGATLPAATWAATDYRAAIGWARDLLVASSRPQKQVVLVTDLQRSGLTGGIAEPLPAGTQFEIEDVGELVSQNLALVQAEPYRTEIRPQEPVALQVTVANHGPVPVENLQLDVELQGPSGVVAAKNSIRVPPAARTTLDVPLAIQRDGTYRGRVTIHDSEGAAWDNQRWVAFEARHPDRLLLVDGQPARSVYASETYYLETALRLRGSGSGPLSRSFEVERIVWEAGEGFPELRGFRGVILANVRRLSGQDRSRLVRFLQAGGGVLVFAGDQLRADDYRELAAGGGLPGNLATTVEVGRATITSFDADHSALRMFADPQRGDLRRIGFERFLPLVDLKADARPLLQCGGKILAAELLVGKGRCIYVGLTADREWTSWPQSSLYVPLVRQLAAYLTDQLSSGTSVRSAMIADKDEQPGIEQLEGKWLVRNVDPRELAPQRLAEDELRRELRLPDELPAAEQQARSAAAALPADALRADELWTWVVWGLLALLLAEMYLAGQIHT